MAKVYAELIMKGKKTLNDVPEQLRGAVIEILMEHVFIPGGQGDAD